jgi:hypothetical protein
MSDIKTVALRHEDQQEAFGEAKRRIQFERGEDYAEGDVIRELARFYLDNIEMDAEKKTA